VNTETEMRMTTTTRTARRVVLAIAYAMLCALVLVGCKSGTPSRGRNRLASPRAAYWPGEITCTGSASVVRSELSLSIIDADGNLSGNYKLNATISAKKGEAKAYVSTTGGKEGGKVAPANRCASAPS